MPKATHAGPSYDPNGPFTGNPHDDRPETVLPADLEQAGETDEVTVTDQTEETGTSEETPGQPRDEGRDQDQDKSSRDDDVPTRAGDIAPWVRAGGDRLEQARRLGLALRVERDRPTPRSSVVRELEQMQSEINDSSAR